MKEKLAKRRLAIKIIVLFIIVSVCMLLLIRFFITYTLTTQEADLMMDKEKTDIIVLEQYIGYGDWHIDDGVLMKGDIVIGDGTEEKAMLEPFLRTEKDTGSFCYVFMKVPDREWQWVGDEETGYMQGHYMRVAGSTLSPEGKSIIGTFMDVKVADILDEKGYYAGNANVAGGLLYCYYQTFADSAGETVGCVVVGRNIDDMANQVHDTRRGLDMLVAMSVLLAAMILAIMARKAYGRFSLIRKQLEIVSSGQFPENELDTEANDEISLIADSVNRMVISLKEKERMGAELSVATKIQQNLLPQTFPPYADRPELDIFGSMNPAKEVAGDFYDFFLTDENHLVLCVGDVSGKGIPAALFMVKARTLLRNKSMKSSEMESVFAHINNALCENNQEGMFVTCWMADIDLETGEMIFVNAGHNPPLIKHGDGSYEYLESNANLVMAWLEETPYSSNSTFLNKGDSIVIYTDGVTEATDKNNELYGEERLIKFLNSRKFTDMRDTCTSLLEDVMSFTGEAEQFDDITMLGFNYVDLPEQDLPEHDEVKPVINLEK